MASIFETKRVNVYPKTIQPSKIIKLTNLDRQCPTLMYLVFFYNPSHYNNFSNDSIFSKLEGSLEETLSIWYPAAGRLWKNPNNGDKLDLWCNNGGVVMVEAFTQTRFSELGNLSQYNKVFENLVYKPNCNGNYDISEMPLLVAQVSLICTSSVLFVCFFAVSKLFSSLNISKYAAFWGSFSSRGILYLHPPLWAWVAVFFPSSYPDHSFL